MFLVLSIRCCRSVTQGAKTVELLAFLINVSKTVACRLIVYEKERIYFLTSKEVKLGLWGGEAEEGGFHALTVSSKMEVYQHLSFVNTSGFTFLD